MKELQIKILADIIKALLPYIEGTQEQFEAAEAVNFSGSKEHELTGYDLFENACCNHYRLVHGTEMPLELEIEDYAKTL